MLTVPLNLKLCFFHFLKELRISDDTSCIANLSTSLVKPGYTAHDSAFSDVRQVRNLLEWL